MRKVAIVLLLILAGISTGCATRAVQTEALLTAPGELKTYHRIENVKFIHQTAGYCGPAVLTMAMNSVGHKITVDEVAKQVYTPGFRGSLQADIISASRRQGFMAVQINGLANLLNEVSAGHPVIIFENLGLSWAPNWHYALVLGYDLKTEEVIMHSGNDPFYHWDMKKFERSWMLGDYWGLVILPPGELAVGAGEIAHVTAAVGLESAKKTDEALRSYRKILQKWPTSLVALIGLANIAYSRGDLMEAKRLLQLAVQEHPTSAPAKHNLAFLSKRENK